MTGMANKLSKTELEIKDDKQLRRMIEGNILTLKNFIQLFYINNNKAC